MKTIPNEQLCFIVEKNNRSGGYRDISDKIRLTVQYIQCKVFTRCFAQKIVFERVCIKTLLSIEVYSQNAAHVGGTEKG